MWRVDSSREAVRNRAMPLRPGRRLVSDNIKRVHAKGTAQRLLAALGTLRGKSGLWPENDPEASEAWWDAVLADPRARATRMERIPANHRDASLRLDRCKALAVTVSCSHCSATAVYAIDDLRASFGDGQNITRLPAYLLPCRSKRDRREGACELRATPGGMTEGVRTVKGARGGVG